MDELSDVSTIITSNNETKQDTSKIEWSQEHEEILVEWADKAACYRWLHDTAHQRMALIHAWFTIPVIILSTLTGTANFAQERFPIEYRATAVMIIGGLNIVAGIITTIAQFLKISERNEGHRVSSIAWGKFNRNIKIELTKRPIERTAPDLMIKSFKEEYDRLSETSPIIPQLIITMFLETFSDLEEFDNFSKPEICNELKSTKDVMFKSTFINNLIDTNNLRDTEKNIEKDINKSLNNGLNLLKNDLLNEFEKISEKKNEFVHNVEEKLKEEEDNIKQLTNEARQQFIELYNREPLEDELEDAVDDLRDSIILEEGKYTTI